MKKVKLFTIRKKGKTRGRPSLKEKIAEEILDWCMHQPKYQEIFLKRLEKFVPRK